MHPGSICYNIKFFKFCRICTHVERVKIKNMLLQPAPPPPPNPSPTLPIWHTISTFRSHLRRLLISCGCSMYASSLQRCPLFRGCPLITTILLSQMSSLQRCPLITGVISSQLSIKICVYLYYIILRTSENRKVRIPPPGWTSTHTSRPIDSRWRHRYQGVTRDQKVPGSHPMRVASRHYTIS